MSAKRSCTRPFWICCARPATKLDSIAASTRCSKATLYRQWAGKPELVAQALRHGKNAGVILIDTGSLHGDFHAMVEQLDDLLMSMDAALARSMIHAVHDDQELLQALRDTVVDSDLAGLDVLLRRAVERGEVRPDCPALAYIPHLLAGALFAHPLIADEPIDRSFLSRYVDAVVLPGLRA